MKKCYPIIWYITVTILIGCESFINQIEKDLSGVWSVNAFCGRLNGKNTVARARVHTKTNHFVLLGCYLFAAIRWTSTLAGDRHTHTHSISIIVYAVPSAHVHFFCVERERKIKFWTFFCGVFDQLTLFHSIFIFIHFLSLFEIHFMWCVCIFCVFSSSFFFVVVFIFFSYFYNIIVKWKWHLAWAGGHTPNELNVLLHFSYITFARNWNFEHLWSTWPLTTNWTKTSSSFF